MRKERKVLFEKINELDAQRMCELEMWCGFGVTEVNDCFAPYFQELETKLAKTYGMSVDEYDSKMYEINDMVMKKVYGADELPFI